MTNLSGACSGALPHTPPAPWRAGPPSQSCGLTTVCRHYVQERCTVLCVSHMFLESQTAPTPNRATGFPVVHLNAARSACARSLRENKDRPTGKRGFGPPHSPRSFDGSKSWNWGQTEQERAEPAAGVTRHDLSGTSVLARGLFGCPKHFSPKVTFCDYIPPRLNRGHQGCLHSFGPMPKREIHEVVIFAPSWCEYEISKSCCFGSVSRRRSEIISYVHNQRFNLGRKTAPVYGSWRLSKEIEARRSTFHQAAWPLGSIKHLSKHKLTARAACLFARQDQSGKVEVL